MKIEIELAHETGKIRIADPLHGTCVVISRSEDGSLHTSIGNGEVDFVQIESREEIKSIKSTSGADLKGLIK